MFQLKIIGARRIKAARALLNWSQDELAVAARLSIATIRKLEAGFVSPRGKTNDAVRGAFENAGLEFIEPEGVRFKPMPQQVLFDDPLEKAGLVFAGSL